MEKQGHKIAGAIVGLILIGLGFVLFKWFLLSWKEFLSALMIVAIYPLLPDIDHRSSTVTWLFILFSIIGLIASKVIELTEIKVLSSDYIFYFSCGLLTITYFCVEHFAHRGLTHSLIFGLIVSVPLVLFLPWYFAVLAFVCYYTHLVCDKIPLKLY